MSLLISLLVTSALLSPSWAVTYTMKEVAQHRTPRDCWIVIEGSVFNVTDYLAEHERHSPILPKVCGTDASQGWKTKGPHKNKEHSKKAQILSQKYKIGEL